MSEDTSLPWHQKNLNRVIGAIALGVMALFFLDQSGYLQKFKDNSVAESQQKMINARFLELEKKLLENDTINKSNLGYEFSVDWQENGMLDIDLKQNDSIVSLKEALHNVHMHVVKECERNMKAGDIKTCSDLNLRLRIFIE